MLKRVFIGVVLLVAVVWLLQKLDMLPENIFKEQPVAIDETAILIKNIKSIAQLVTVVAYDEVVVDSTIIDKESRIRKLFNPFSTYPILPVVDSKIVLIGRGKVLAGTDISNLNTEDITVVNDTVFLKMKYPVILDAVINPSDFETFDEKGNWSDEAVIAVKLKAKKIMIDRALQNDILKKANDKAKSVMENFLLSAGYKHVRISVK